jgi:hypothetical protein
MKWSRKLGTLAGIDLRIHVTEDGAVRHARSNGNLAEYFSIHYAMEKNGRQPFVRNALPSNNAARIQ